MVKLYTSITINTTLIADFIVRQCCTSNQKMYAKRLNFSPPNTLDTINCQCKNKVQYKRTNNQNGHLIIYLFYFLHELAKGDNFYETQACSAQISKDLHQDRPHSRKIELQPTLILSCSNTTQFASQMIGVIDCNLSFNTFLFKFFLILFDRPLEEHEHEYSQNAHSTSVPIDVSMWVFALVFTDS